MTTPQESLEHILLAAEDQLGQLPVRLTCFEEFETKVELGLENLVLRWSHAAAPHATSERKVLRRPMQGK